MENAYEIGRNILAGIGLVLVVGFVVLFALIKALSNCDWR